MFAKLEFNQCKNLCFRKTLKKIKKTVTDCEKLFTPALDEKTAYIQNKYRTLKT